MASDITNLIRYIRLDTGDDGDTQTYTDTQLVSMVSKATIRVDADIAGCLNPPTSGGIIFFEQTTSGSTFLASGNFGYTLSSGTLWTSSSGLPTQLFNLVMLKAECLLAKRSHFDAAGKAIRVRDGDTEIDTSVGFGGLRDLTSGAGGPCAEYEKALKAFCDWLQDQFGGDITQFARIIWKGNIRHTQAHSQVGPYGDWRTEIMADFSDYFGSNMNQDHGNESSGPTVSR